MFKKFRFNKRYRSFLRFAMFISAFIAVIGLSNVLTSDAHASTINMTDQAIWGSINNGGACGVVLFPNGVDSAGNGTAHLVRCDGGRDGCFVIRNQDRRELTNVRVGSGSITINTSGFSILYGFHPNSDVVIDNNTGHRSFQCAGRTTNLEGPVTGATINWPATPTSPGGEGGWTGPSVEDCQQYEDIQSMLQCLRQLIGLDPPGPITPPAQQRRLTETLRGYARNLGHVGLGEVVPNASGDEVTVTLFARNTSGSWVPYPNPQTMSVDRVSWNDNNFTIELLAVPLSGRQTVTFDRAPAFTDPNGDTWSIDDAIDYGGFHPMDEMERGFWDECNIGALSWAVCPTGGVLTEFADDIYSQIEQELRIPIQFVQTDGPAYRVWAGFRDLANIIFVILTLVAIISQLTGYGLSNYNIKRMLPRLLVVAILVNLSFFISQLAVDLSNILGSQLQSMLSNQAGWIYYEKGWTRSLLTDSEFDAVGPVVGVTAIVGIAKLLAALLTGGAILVPALMFIIMGVVVVALAVTFFFAILQIRQIAVIVLVVMSPLAMVCLLTPWTEGLFRKYWSVFKAMLIVYPIAGLLYGGGKLVGAIIAPDLSGSAEGDYSNLTTFNSVTKLVVMAAPLFAVIALSKASLTGLGSLGSKLTAGVIGAQLGLKAGALKTGARVNKAYDESSMNQDRKIKRLQDAANKKGLLGKFTGGIAQSRLGRGVGLDKSINRNLGRAVATKAGDDKKIQAGMADLLAGAGVGEPGNIQGEAEYVQAFKSLQAGDSNAMSSLIQRYDDSGRTGDLMSIMNAYGSSMNGKTAQSMYQMLGNTKNIKNDTLASAYMKSVQDHVEDQMIANGGDMSKVRVDSFRAMLNGTGKNDMAAQMKKMDAAKLGEISKTSLGFLTGMAKSGAAGQATVDNLFSQVSAAETAKAFASMSGDKAGSIDLATGDTKMFATVVQSVGRAQANGINDIVKQLSANDLTKMSGEAATYLNNVDKMGALIVDNTGTLLMGRTRNDSTLHTLNGEFAASMPRALSEQQRANISNTIIRSHI